MKNLYVFLVGISVWIGSYAQAPFTVTSHNAVDMTWYGTYDQWAQFPNGAQTYRKIILHYTMGCATGGCSPWDYTTQIQLRHRTGAMDSTLQQQASFTVNGNILDTVYFNTTTTYTTFYDTVATSTDSTANASMMIVVYGNPSNPTVPTDTVNGYAANYWNYDFDNLGNIVDSNFVMADSSWYLTYAPYYNVFEVIETYELARVITPYGGNLPASYAFTQDFDVTDFAGLLQDSVEIRAFYSGWSSGFSATLDFEFFPGTPARDVMDVSTIYRGDFGYSNSAYFESNILIPKNKFILPGVAFAKVRMTSTGHGFDNDVNAAEFFPAMYYLKIDGIQTHSQLNFDDLCGENPIYPDFETGSSYVHTWLYDRANWCPGKRAAIHQFNISPYITPNDTVNINVDWQNYVWSGAQGPLYTIDCQLVQYGAAHFTNDVEITEIIAPTDKDEYARLNPICSFPRVTIRNYGSNALTSCDIDYHIDGGPTETFHWTGSLPFMDTVSVDLPISDIAAFWMTTTNAHIFYATVKNPNGVADQYLANNDLTSTYTDVPTYDADIIVNVRTNNMGSETAYRLIDGDGNTIFSKSSLSNATTYTDTLHLAWGCYKFEITDAGEDGLYWYFNASAGTGYARLKRASNGSIFKTYKPNFGSEYTDYFKVGYQFGIEETQLETDMLIYPNPSTGEFNVDLVGFGNGEITVQVYNTMGQLIANRMVHTETGQEIISMNISNVSDGIYIVRVAGNGYYHSQQIIKKGN
jgi:hypothetical protein